MQVTAYVALGTNLGDLKDNLDGAFTVKVSGVHLLAVSLFSCHRSQCSVHGFYSFQSSCSTSKGVSPVVS